MDAHRALALLLSPATTAIISILGIHSMYPDPVGLILSLALIVVCPVIKVVSKSLSGDMDILVPDRHSRGTFFVQAIICYSSGTILLFALGNRVFGTLSLSYMMVTIVVAIVNRFVTKISVHMAGLAGPATFLILAGNHYLGMFLFTLVPVLAWSRWRSGSHTIMQIALGMMISIVITLATCLAIRSFEKG